MSERKLLHGGDYNPEQWLDRPDILEQDITMMKQARVNVVTLGVFSWSVMVGRGRGNTTSTGLKRSSTPCMPTVYRPFWPPPARRARPGWRRNTPRCAGCGPTAPGNCSAAARTTCYTSPLFRQKVRAIDEQLARRFAATRR